MFLSSAYWANQRTRDTILKSLEHSLCFGLYHHQNQIGLARVVTDYATFTYLCDVFVLEEYRGRGLGKYLMQTVIAHPDLIGIRRFMLATRDAHGLYEQYGFESLSAPERWMERFDKRA
jgi:GNAT superfamily N-acetyltransferase